MQFTQDDLDAMYDEVILICEKDTIRYNRRSTDGMLVLYYTWLHYCTRNFNVNANYLPIFLPTYFVFKCS